LVNESKKLDFCIEWSVNEKVAFETALGASICGARAMAVMKHVGVNVAQDALMSATYMGVNGGLVLVSADDPGQWSSQNEQDNRYIAEMGYIPVLEPSSVQEAKDMTREAFRLSEQFGQIYMLRSVTRIGHARSDVKLDKINKLKREHTFKREQGFLCLPTHARKNRVLMIERFAGIKEAVDSLSFNQLKLASNARLGIIASGISYSYTSEALHWLHLEDKVSVLKIGTPHPLPENMVKQLLTSVPVVLVMEELEPFVENHVKVIAQENGINVKIHGKDILPRVLELSTRKATEAITTLIDIPLPIDFAKQDKIVEEVAPLLPLRPPTLCAGCPHRASLYAINIASQRVKKDLGEHIYTGDIGCYGLGAYPPLKSDDIAICMGSGFGVANGVVHVLKNPVIGHLGDSTFFHSGIPPMINAVFNNTKITMVILDNSTTAMTGFQSHPGTGITAKGVERPKLRQEDIVRACKVNFVEVVDPFDIKRTINILEEAIRFDGPAVVITRQICNILRQKEKRKLGEKIIPYEVDQEKCRNCRLCIKSLGCPALIIDVGRVTIDADQCAGCGVCAQVCPQEAIIQGEGK